MTWKRGPLPKNTFQWGGVVPTDENTHGGFYFADFCGDHVKIMRGKDRAWEVLKPEQVAWYDNSLEWPAPSNKTTKEELS